MACKKDIETLTKYFKDAEAEGYVLEYTELPDRLKVAFSYKNDYNDGDYYKEYVEYLDNYVICYGEFGTFTFKLHGINRKPDKFYLYNDTWGVTAQFGMLDKLVGDIVTERYDCELAEEDFKIFLTENDAQEDYSLLDDFYKDILADAIYSEDTYKEKALEVCQNLIDALTESNLLMGADYYDLWEQLYNIGLRCTNRTLIIIMILTLIGVDFKAKNTDSEKDTNICQK